MRKSRRLQALLDSKYRQYAKATFVEDDPVRLPHSYSDPRDIEIVAFWVAILSWGQRVTIINKSRELFALMGDSPYRFIVEHKEKDRKRFLDFKHRTFQATDTLYFLEFLQRHFRESDTMQHLFLDEAGQLSIAHFHDQFFRLDVAPQRTRKHVSTTIRGSTCKRLCMFLRWMVRSTAEQVDLGLWQDISTSDLYIPLDVHVHRSAIRLGLLSRKQRDWRAVLELTQTLRKYDAQDPVKYDFALFGMGIHHDYAEGSS